MAEERFAGRVAVVTGAASGIGAAAARRLAGEGAAVVLADVVAEAGQALVAELAATGARASYQHCDVASAADWAALAAAARAAYGRVDILVSNAGVNHRQPAHELPEEIWDRLLAVDLKASYLGVRALHPDLSVVVLVSSVHALLGLPGNPGYAAAKGGLVALGRQLAVEYGPGVRVNTVLPGPIETPAWRRISDADRRRTAAATVLARLGTPEEVAAVIAFLAGPDASYVTGAALVVDGGMTSTRDTR